jgi:hypothetical protein
LLKIEIILNGFQNCLVSKEHVPDFEYLEQLDQFFLRLSLLPDQWEQIVNLLLKILNIISLDVLDDGVDDVYQLVRSPGVLKAYKRG